MRIAITTFQFSLVFTFTALLNATESKPNNSKPPKFYVHAGKIKRNYACAAGVEAGYIRNGIVHANLRRGDDRYLLIAYSEESRPGSPNSMCGGGTESYLVWLHIRNSTVIAMQSAQYESCWKNIDRESSAWTDQALIIKYTRVDCNFDTHQCSILQNKATFDPRAPEKGIEIITTVSPGPTVK